MNSEQLITVHLQSYRSMRSTLGRDDPLVEESFGKLWDLIMVEIYFMKSLRFLLKDEEMSGFIIYINSYIHYIVDSYSPSRGPFMPFLKEALEKHAMSYLREKMRLINIQRTFIELQNPYPLSVAESSPEEILCIREDEAERAIERKGTLQMLSYVCRQNPCRVRKLFVFLCTLMPFLEDNVIDRFCRALNCDRQQTRAIAACLRDVQRKYDRNRSSRAYMSRMVDYHWEKILENEGMARICLHPEKRKAVADFHRSKLDEALKLSKKAKMNISYRVVGNLINLDSTTVGLYVMHSKNILKRILETKPSKAMLESIAKSEIRLPRFEPFREFGICALDKPA